MGSGMAGISAADAALARGKKVIVFEKKPYQGGAVSNCPIAYVSIRKDRAFQNAAFICYMSIRITMQIRL